MVQLDDGTSSPLANLNGGQPFVLVFLRHYGCIFCRYQVAQLRPAADVPIFFVGMGSVDETASFKVRMRSPHRFIADPERILYERFGVARATARQMVTLRAIGQGIRATLAGQVQGRPSSDPMQLGATVIVGRGGEVLWSRFSRDVAEIMDADTIRTQLGRFGQQVTASFGKDEPGGGHAPPSD